ncbi:MAG: response regulator transcription factor [Rhizonema sp. PD38]|nr:response regulator transcription factor [Rhizonema sp. PD38]
MTANSSREAISTAISNGADCYYCKNSAREEVGERFIEAILAAYNNESWIDPTINRIFLESFRSKDPLENKSTDFLSEFSVKEIEILKLTAEGMKNDEIANQMYVSEGTVRSYLHSLYTKLDVKDKLNAIRKGIQLGILTFADMKIEQEIIQDTYPEAKTNRKSKVSKAKETNKGYKGWAA